MIELAQLFQDLDAIVVQQEETVMKIDESGEQVQENVQKANVEIGGAIEKARARNRKKWWCVGISSKFSTDASSSVLALAPVLARKFRPLC